MCQMQSERNTEEIIEQETDECGIHIKGYEVSMR
jgi:hypothetical protein